VRQKGANKKRAQGENFRRRTNLHLTVKEKVEVLGQFCFNSRTKGWLGGGAPRKGRAHYTKTVKNEGRGGVKHVGGSPKGRGYYAKSLRKRRGR